MSDFDKQQSVYETQRSSFDLQYTSPHRLWRTNNNLLPVPAPTIDQLPALKLEHTRLHQLRAVSAPSNALMGVRMPPSWPRAVRLGALEARRSAHSSTHTVG